MSKLTDENISNVIDLMNEVKFKSVKDNFNIPIMNIQKRRKNNEKKITEDFKEILSSIKIKTGEAVNDIVDRVKINLKDKIDNINSDDLIIFFKTRNH